MKASSNIPCLLLAVLVTLGASSVQATKTSDATMFKCSTSAGGKIEVTDGDHKGVEVECKMQRKPTHPVNVVIESTKHTHLSHCNIVYSPQNWTAPVKFRVYPGSGVQTLTNKKDFVEQVGMSCTSNDHSFHGKASTFEVKRVYQAMATCTSWGDPHVVTFDGVKFDNYVEGWHTYVQNERTTIQALHYNCGTSRLCNKGIALQHGGDYMRLMMDVSTQTQSASIQFTNQASGAIKVDTMDGASKAFNIQLQDGTKIALTVVRNFKKTYAYINMVITVPGKYYSSGMTGLCGNFDYIKDNDGCPYGDRIGTKCESYVCTGNQCCEAAFNGVKNPEHCKRAPYGPSLQCTFAPPPPPLHTIAPPVHTSTTSHVFLTTATPRGTTIKPQGTTTAAPHVTTTKSVVHTTTLVVHNTTYVANTTMPVVHTTMPLAHTTTTKPVKANSTPPPVHTSIVPTAIHTSIVPDATNASIVPHPTTVVISDEPVTPEQCESHCKSVFAELKCGNIDVSLFINDCATEATAFGSSDALVTVADSALKTFMSMCAQQTQCLAESPFVEDHKVADQTAATYGITYTPAGASEPKITTVECKNGGVQNPQGGCDCPAGFSGMMCANSNVETIKPTGNTSDATSFSAGAISTIVLIVALLLQV